MTGDEARREPYGDEPAPGQTPGPSSFPYEQQDGQQQPSYPPDGRQYPGHPPDGQQHLGYPPYGQQPPNFYSAYQRHPGQMVVAPKNGGIHLLASFFIPGLGTMLNGQAGKGVVFLLSYFAAVFFGVLLSFILIGFLFFPVALGIWIWGLVDAYQGAQQWNARHGIIS